MVCAQVQLWQQLCIVYVHYALRDNTGVLVPQTHTTHTHTQYAMHSRTKIHHQPMRNTHTQYAMRMHSQTANTQYAYAIRNAQAQPNCQYVIRILI